MTNKPMKEQRNKSYDTSMSYRLRLIWAYKDVVRNHVPMVTKWYIKAFRRSQLKAARRLQNKERIEVAFMLTIPGMWKSDYLFRAMRDNPRYHPYVVIYPYSWYKGFSREEVDATLQRTVKFVADKGFEYVVPYDANRGRWEDIKKTLNPDVVIFSSPYKDHLPQYFVYHFRDRLTCYVPYAFLGLNMGGDNYDLIFHNLVGFYFLETQMHLEDAIGRSRCHGANSVVTGFPGTEVFLRSDYRPTDVWKAQEHPKKRIIWAPHHTIDDTLQLSTFLLCCDEMLLLAKKYKDQVQFAFKPHQLLKFKLQKLWGEERTKNYYDQWATMENTQLEETSYVDLFLTSDAMIHDCGSFTTEYLFVNKPVMYLTHDDHYAERFNRIGLKAFGCHYQGCNIADVERFVRDTVVGNEDPKAADRKQFFDTYLKPIDNMMPSERVIMEIEKAINGEIQ
ncbi:MAG: CDP-glycerol glycerophosphotransferase family protein [Bacteroidales bacterium]|nr:CDP-glycerol glycerophosphotransferase family protein [Bacteroidales bacterium]